MNPDIGKMRCPVCGTQAGARKNKNGIIYTNCPNGHQAKLNNPDSHAAAAALEAGQAWNNGLVYIYPTNKEERKEENDGTKQFRTTGTDGRAVNYGRPDGKPAADSTANNGTDDTSDESDDGDEFGFGLI